MRKAIDETIHYLWSPSSINTMDKSVLFSWRQCCVRCTRIRKFILCKYMSDFEICICNMISLDLECSPSTFALPQSVIILIGWLMSAIWCQLSSSPLQKIAIISIAVISTITTIFTVKYYLRIRTNPLFGRSNINNNELASSVVNDTAHRPIVAIAICVALGIVYFGQLNFYFIQWIFIVQLNHEAVSTSSTYECELVFLLSLWQAINVI